MKRFATGAALLIALGATAMPAFAEHRTALRSAAAQLGYAYAYLGPEDAVALTKTGVTIVIRPGERLFDVNDRTEAMEGTAPEFHLSDILISDAFYKRLRAISVRYPSAVPPPPERYAPPGSVERGPVAAGAISKLTVSQIPGTQEVAVGGKAPANLPITITLAATLSNELPDVVLSRHLVTADPDGTFKTDLSIAPGYFRGSILSVVASSGVGVAPARTTIVLKAPNGGVTVPAEALPKGVR